MSMSEIGSVVPAFYHSVLDVPETYVSNDEKEWSASLELRKKYAGTIYDIWLSRNAPKERERIAANPDISPENKFSSLVMEWNRRWVIALMPNEPGIKEQLPHGAGSFSPIMSSAEYTDRMKKKEWTMKARYLLSNQYYDDILKPRVPHILYLLNMEEINPFVALALPSNTTPDDLYYSLSRRSVSNRLFARYRFIGVSIPPMRVEIIPYARYAKRTYEERGEQQFLIVTDALHSHIIEALGWNESVQMLDPSYGPSPQDLEKKRVTD